MDEFRAYQAHCLPGAPVEAVEAYAIFLLDTTGVVQTWNLGARRIKGYTESEIVGQHFSVFYPPADREAGIPDLELAHAAAHGHWSGEGWRVRKDGSTFWADVVITAVFDHQDNLGGFVKITRDESDRHAAEAGRRGLDGIPEAKRSSIELSEATIRDMVVAASALDGALAMTTDLRVAGRIEEAMTILDRTVGRLRASVTALGDPDDRAE